MRAFFWNEDLFLLLTYPPAHMVSLSFWQPMGLLPPPLPTPPSEDERASPPPPSSLFTKYIPILRANPPIPLYVPQTSTPWLLGGRRTPFVPPLLIPHFLWVLSSSKKIEILAGCRPPPTTWMHPQMSQTSRSLEKEIQNYILFVLFSDFYRILFGCFFFLHRIYTNAPK